MVVTPLTVLVRVTSAFASTASLGSKPPSGLISTVAALPFTVALAVLTEVSVNRFTAGFRKSILL